MTTAVLAAVPRYHRWPAVVGSIAAVLLVAVASCEVLGWPFLAEPAQRWLTQVLQRDVSMTVDGHMPASVRVRLLGRLRIEAPQIEIGGAHGAAAPAALRARDAVMTLRYADLWRARDGERLRIHRVEAAQLQVPDIGIELAQTKPCALCMQARVDLTM